MILTKEIADNNYNNLTNIVIPSGITTIADYAFADRTDLVSVVIPDTVNTIGKYAFSGCINLEKIYLSANLTTISEDAFSDCLNLSRVFIPISNTVIDDRMFTWCPSIVYVSEPINNEGEDTDIDKTTVSEANLKAVISLAPADYELHRLIGKQYYAFNRNGYCMDIKEGYSTTDGTTKGEGTPQGTSRAYEDQYIIVKIAQQVHGYWSESSGSG